MKNHDCGCVTERGIYRNKCEDAQHFTDEINWAYSQDAVREVDYYAWQLEQHIKTQ